MSARMLRGLLLAIAVVVVPVSAARAQVFRTAVVVGNNDGLPGRPPLRYAEADAAKVARVLVEMGAFAREDVYLLRGRDVVTLRRALAGVRQKVAAWHAQYPTARMQLVFYFSGHSDGMSLEVGATRFAFTELKQGIADTGADVRVLIIDSCKSGSLLTSKGGIAGHGFDIQLADALSSSGEALLTSSAANESALESDEIHGSFFSHNLVSALRGAGDVSGDGKVSLTEAYQYAFARTLFETSGTIYGPQHAGYDFRLSGQGDLVLTDIGRPTAALDLPDGYDRFLVTATAGAREVVAEVNRTGARRIGVMPGAYAVRAWRRQERFQGIVTVGSGVVRVLADADLLPFVGGLAMAKGDGSPGGRGFGDPSVSVAATTGGTPSSDSSTWMVAASGLVSGWFGTGTHAGSAFVGTRLAVGTARVSGWSGALQVMTDSLVGAADVNGHATAWLGSAGYRRGLEQVWRGRPLRLWLSLEAGGGVIADRQSGSATAFPVTTMGGAGAGFSFGFTRTIAVQVEGQYLLHLVPGQSGMDAFAVPRAWAGLALSL